MLCGWIRACSCCASYPFVYWFVCHQNYVCEDSIGSVYCCGSEIKLCVSVNCVVGLLVVCECSSVLLHSIVMSYVDCGDDG